MTDWRDLKIGDVVVMTRIPDSVLKSHPSVRDGPDGFLRVYQRAVSKLSRLHVTMMDEFGRPWVEYIFRNKGGMTEHHSMLVDDDAYDRVS